MDPPRNRYRRPPNGPLEPSIPSVMGATSETLTSAPPTRPPERPPSPPGGSVPGGRRGRRDSRGGRPGWIAIAIIVVLLACGLTTCGALAGIGVFGGAKTKAEQAKKQADDHWQSATRAMEAVSATLDKAQPARPKTLASDIARVTGQAKKGVDAARADLKAAAAALAPLRPSKMKTAYTGAVREADAALADLDNMLTYIEHIGRLYEISIKGTAQLRAATLNLDRAISSANQSNYAATKRFATRASDSLTVAIALYAAGDKIDHSAGFSKAVAYAAKLKEEAVLLTQLADAGSKKQVAQYNALAARQRVVQQAIAAMAPPEVVATTNWAALGLKRYQDSIQQHLDKGQALYEQAQKAFISGNY